MTTNEPEPTPDEAAAPPERQREEEAMTYPGHDDPDTARENVGLDDVGRPEPEGPPAPRE